MYSLLIAEDEPLERSGLRKLIEKEFKDIDILPDAANGREALEYIGRYAPDILLLDIQMPFINGIEVLKSLRTSAYDGQILIISAHDEFEYVKDALNHGANTFLLKPETPENLKTALTAAIDAVQKKRLNCLNQVQQENLLVGMAAYITNEVVHRIVSNESITQEMVNRLDQMGIEFSTGFFITVHLPKKELGKYAVHFDPSVNCFEKARNLVREQLVVDAKVVVSDTIGESFSILLASPQLKSATWYQSLANEAESQISAILFRAMRLSPRIGIGSPQDRITRFHISFWESMQAMYRTSEESRVFLQRRLRPEPLERALAALHATDPADEKGNLLPVLRNLITALCIPEEGIDFIEQKGIVATFWMNLLLHFQTEFSDSLLGDEEYALNERFFAAQNARALRSMVLERSAAMLDHRRRKERYSVVVQKATDFINEHYSSDISLDILSGVLGVTPAYISFLFKRELGQTFSDYLLDVRMNQLSCLLLEGNDSVNVLAGKLGYRDATYFCRVVKKATGKTIRQLQQDLREKEGAKHDI